MGNWFAENWLTVLGATGALSAPLAWVFGGRQAQKVQLKKDSVEVKTAEVDYAAKISELYEGMMTDIKTDRDAVKAEKDALSVTIKEEREYFRTQLDDVRKMVANTQEQLNNLQLAYAKEVEKSQNWEKLHRELGDRYNILEKEYIELKDLYEKLKKDFEKYKKDNK